MRRAEHGLPDLPADEVKAEQHRQQSAQGKDYHAGLARLDNVAFQISVANRSYCKLGAPRLGVNVATTQSLPRKYRAFARETLHVDETYATAISVAQRSPAAAAGIKVGDQILTLNNEPIPAKKPGEWIESRLDRNGEAPVTIMVRHDDKDDPRTVYPVMACAVPVELATDPAANAFTDGGKIVIHSGILRLAPNDADLAVIVGHELAHITMGHYGKKLQNTLLGGLGGAFIDGGLMLGGIYTGGAFYKHLEAAGERTFSVAFEREADYVGAYYAARAGYDISGAANIWRALALENPANNRTAKTHPTAPARFVQMQKTIAEIADKKRLHLPLEPDLKLTTTQPAEPTAPAAY